MQKSGVAGVGTCAAAKPGMPGVVARRGDSVSLPAAMSPRNFELRSNELVIKSGIQGHPEVFGADKSSQLAYIAINKRGEVGGASIRRGFQFAVYKDGVNKLYDAKFLYNR